MPPETRRTARLSKALQYRPVVITNRCPATTTVFNNVEMLEMILTNLSLSDLNRMELLHPVWKQIIRTSTKLQVTRFSKAKTTSEVMGSNASTIDINNKSMALTLKVQMLRVPAASENLDICTICNLHPALIAIHSDLLVFGIKATTILGWTVPGLWQDQLIVQPPLLLHEELFLWHRLGLHLFQHFPSLGSMYFSAGVIRRGAEHEIEGSRKGLVNLGHLRKWVEEMMAKHSTAEVAKRTLLFAAPLRQEERSRTVVHARRVDRGELVPGTLDAMTAWKKLFEPSLIHGKRPLME